MPVNKGSYALVLNLSAERRIQVGRLGNFIFPPGFYLYFGSALNSLTERVNRHLRAEKKLRWHIDYLAAQAEIQQVWAAADGAKRECQWTVLALECPGVATPVTGFGSSDCGSCVSHLVHAASQDAVDRIWQVVGQTAGARVFAPAHLSADELE